MRTLLLLLTASAIRCALGAAEPTQDGQYYDEAHLRYLKLESAGSGSTRVVIRFANDPGSNSKWMGLGQRTDKGLNFAQEVEEGQDRGTFYLANISESKVEVVVKPGQKKAQDAGIVGTYRRVSESKLQQLAKKEVQLGNARLVTALKNATKKWASAERPALNIWKDQWPSMRDRWMDIAFKAPKPDPSAKSPAVNPNSDKPAEYWFKLAEATMLGYGFVEGMPQPKTGTDWQGEYDDFAGGHASISSMRDGGLHVTLTFSRAQDAQTGTIDALVKAADVGKDKSGCLNANFTVIDPEVKDPAEQAKVHLTKHGRYLQVGVDNAQHYTKRGWFDGIYRGSPPPTE